MRSCSRSPEHRLRRKRDASSDRPKDVKQKGKRERSPSDDLREQAAVSKHEKKDDRKKDKKAKKAAKKAKKLAKKEKKLQKKVAKQEKKLAKAKKKNKKGSSSSSSSSDSDSDADDLNFVLPTEFSTSGRGMDPRNPDAKIQKALGLTCGYFSFIERDDDEKVAKEALADRHKSGEDQTRDWICQKVKANGDICNGRNFVKNERCYSCNSLRPKHTVNMKEVEKQNKKLGFV